MSNMHSNHSGTKLEISNGCNTGKKKKIHKYVEVKQHIPEQLVIKEIQREIRKYYETKEK